MTVTDTTVLETVLRRDRWVVVSALVAVIVVAWIWIVLGAGTGMSAVAMTQMAGMPDMDIMMERAVWTPAYAALIFTMWWVMMVAMMLPGAAPMLLLFARVNRAQKARDRPYVATGIFAAGYLAAWGGFGASAPRGGRDLVRRRRYAADGGVMVPPQFRIAWNRFRHGRRQRFRQGVFCRKRTDRCTA